jgi:aspartate racemase
MKTIGLLGGMTWHSTIEYYRLINTSVQTQLGGNHSARCILYSAEFAEVEELQESGGWDALSAFMTDLARRVEKAGADFLVICANTMHRTAPAIESAVSIPLLHIADATAAEVKKQQLRKVGLLGTRYTMEMEFYRERLQERHGLEVLIPDAEQRKTINDVIYEELGRGVIRSPSRESYVSIIDSLHGRGAQGIILGCTEIPLLIKPADYPIPMFDTTAIHATAAVDWALR